jgi:hypothetical protein
MYKKKNSNMNINFSLSPPFSLLTVKRVFLLLLLPLLVGACGEDVDRLPQINPGVIELSATQPEGYFQVSPRDYEMCLFSINIDEHRETEDCRVYDKLGKGTPVVAELSDGYKATIYSKDKRLVKIDLGFMIIEKVGRGKYRVERVPNSKVKYPFGAMFGFKEDGISSATIIFK